MNFGSKQLLRAIQLSEQTLNAGSGDLKKMVIFLTDPPTQTVKDYIKRLQDRNIQASVIALSPPLSENNLKGLDPRVNVIILSRDNGNSVVDGTEIFIRSGKAECYLTVFGFFSIIEKKGLR